MWHKMREEAPFHTTGSLSLQLLAWVVFTTTVRSLHFVFQLASPLELLSQTACSLPFTRLHQTFFILFWPPHFCRAQWPSEDSFLQKHVWLLSSVLLQEDRAQAYLLCHKCNSDGKHAQKWDPCECLPRQVCDLLLSFHVLILMTLKNSSEYKKETQLKKKKKYH